MSGQDQINKSDIEWIKNTLTEIKVQTTKTNGRVTAIEMWQARVKGMYAVGIFVLVPIIGFISSYLVKILTG